MIRDWLRGLGELLDLCPWRIPMLAWLAFGAAIILAACELIRALK